MKENMNSREISLQRANELKSKIDEYLDAKIQIPKGRSPESIERSIAKKAAILNYFNATEEEWNDWNWQIKNRISDIDALSKLLKLDDEEVGAISKVGEKYRWAISPYYLSLIDDSNKLDPIKLQCVPTHLELLETGKLDPMCEEFTNPAGSITRRYPDRLIIYATNECAMYCRHCQRRRHIGENDSHTSREKLSESIEYIRSNPEIRDVLVTGGDALALPDSELDWLLGELQSIPTVDYIRLGTRMIVTMPQRITDDLISIIKKHSPIYINTQFNHPSEITADTKRACDKLVEAGIPLGNQAVLLNSINNDKFTMRLLNQELLKCRVRPYYIFHAKKVKGTLHFNTSIEDGIEIMEHLRGYTSGMAIPSYIINAPGGYGKTPMMPEYLVSHGKHSIKIRTWEGRVMDYPNQPTVEMSELLQKK